MRDEPVTQISARELQEYWQAFDELKPGTAMDRAYGTREMPPWQELCYELDWDLYWVEGSSFSKRYHGYCGVYRLVALANTEGDPKPAQLDRVCGSDPTGTLYIGEAGGLSERLNQMRRSFGREDSHGASSFWRQSSALRARFPLTKLGIALLYTGTKVRQMVERDLVRAYLNSFGDTPPLNCSY